MKRQVADIYAAMSSLRQQSVQTRILDPTEDSKLRTTQGRRNLETRAATAGTTTRMLRSTAAPELDIQRREHVFETVDRAREKADAFEQSTDGAMMVS
jgi:hypothetical protein